MRLRSQSKAQKLALFRHLKEKSTQNREKKKNQSAREKKKGEKKRHTRRNQFVVKSRSRVKKKHIYFEYVKKIDNTTKRTEFIDNRRGIKKSVRKKQTRHTLVSLFVN